VLLLLERNADVSKRSRKRTTALGNAVRNGHLGIALLLLDIGLADVNQRSEDCTPLILAALNSDKEMTDLLLEHDAEVFGWYTNYGYDAVQLAPEAIQRYLYDIGVKQRERPEGK